MASAAAVSPEKKVQVPSPGGGLCDARAIATAMDPGPVVIGTVSGKNAMPS